MYKKTLALLAGASLCAAQLSGEELDVALSQAVGEDSKVRMIVEFNIDSAPGARRRRMLQSVAEESPDTSRFVSGFESFRAMLPSQREGTIQGSPVPLISTYTIQSLIGQYFDGKATQASTLMSVEPTFEGSGIPDVTIQRLNAIGLAII
eukprot:GDKK01026905.1.p1 GENE.GDKK01026905.1~~GDKK01026905.1.p1  ORF type:complete len:150 (+),score=32.71 GDKK01026905.1:15-464(+)